MDRILTFKPGDERIVEFVEFGRRHRARFPYVIAPFPSRELEDLRQIPDTRINCYLAQRDGRTIARLAAMYNPHMIAESGKLGLMGYFDAIEDRAVVEQLIAEATAWLVSIGCNRCWAPVDWSIWINYRFASDHFEAPPFVGEPKNPSYYPAFFEGMGFTPVKDWASWWVDRAAMRELLAQAKPHYERFLHAGYRLEPMSRKDPEGNMELIYDMSMEMFKGFTGFYPLDRNEFHRLYKPMFQVMDRNATFFVHDRHGLPMGYIISLQDKGRALASMQGRKGPGSLLRYLWNGRKERVGNISHGLLLYGPNKEAIAYGKEKYGQPISCMSAAVYGSMYSFNQRDLDGFLFAMMAADSKARKFLHGKVNKEHRYHLYEKHI